MGRRVSGDAESAEIVILSEAKDPLILCRGSFGVFAPQDDEKTGLSLPDFFTTSPTPLRMTLYGIRMA